MTEDVTQEVRTPSAEHSLAPRQCPIAATLDIVGERWSLVAIRELLWGVHRFDQIAAYTGATRDILAHRLRKLEQYGIVERRQYSQHQNRFEYHLTDKGNELLPVLIALGQWGNAWALETDSMTCMHDCGGPLGVEVVCRDCGHTASPDSIRPPL